MGRQSHIYYVLKKHNKYFKGNTGMDIFNEMNWTSNMNEAAAFGVPDKNLLDFAREVNGDICHITSFAPIKTMSDYFKISNDKR